MITRYIDIEIEFGARTADGFPFSIQSATGGQTRAVLRDIGADPAFQQLVERVSRLRTDEDMLIEMGTLLYQALFTEGPRGVLTRTQGSQGPGQGIRLKLSIYPTEAEVAALPWEFLYDPDQKNPLALLDTSIVRYPQASINVPKLATTLPLRVLLTAAQPSDLDATYADRELDAIKAALADQNLLQSGQIEIIEERHLTRQKLQRLLRQNIQVWHFAGHGGLSANGKTGMLLLEDSSGSQDSLSAREAGVLLNGTGVRLVVLDACESGRLATAPFRSMGPALVNSGVPAVVAMQFTVPEEATTAFSGEFYHALASGLPVDACVTEGRKSVMGVAGLRRPDWGIPVVYTRATDGTLFDLPSKPEITPAQPVDGGVSVNISGNQINNSSVNVSEVGSISKSQGPSVSDQIAQLNGQMGMLRERLHLLEMRAAMQGISVDPGVTIEIRQLREQEAEIKRKLADLGR